MAMPTQEKLPRGLTWLIILGAVVVALFVFAGLALPSILKYKLKPMQKPVIDMQLLGEMGVACGGPERYPCKPGLVCSVPPEAWSVQYGTCVADANTPPPKEAGEECVGDYQCDFDLRCVKGPDSPIGTCDYFTPDSPSF